MRTARILTASVLLLLSACAAQNAKRARTEQLTCIDRNVAEMRTAMQLSDELHQVKVAEIECAAACDALKVREQVLAGQLEHADREAAQTAATCQGLKAKADDSSAAARAAAQNSVSCTTSTVGATTFTNCN